MSKPFIFIFLFSWSALAVYSQQSGQSKPFTVTGKINGQLNARQVIFSYKDGADSIVDSVPVERGNFTYQGNAEGPVLVKATVDYGNGDTKPAGDYLNFFVDGTTVQLQSADSIKKAKVTGSPAHEEYLEYTQLVLKYFSATTTLNARLSKAIRDGKAGGPRVDSLRAARDLLAKEREAAFRAYIHSHPGSNFGLKALKELAGSRIDVQVYEPLFLQLAEKVRHTPAGIEFADRLEKTKRTAIGSIAPDFTQNDVDGNPVTLSNFRGKYVLLEFWASWCGPCRRENPHVVNVYHKYKDKDFTVLGVSLDMPGKMEDWRAAIRKDKLEWTQVSDLNYWENAVAKLYGVVAIPQNYLIDKTGKIIGSNLKGAELENKLKEVLSY